MVAEEVYIVDEEYHFAENVASALRFEGAAAKVFPDATEAFEFLSSHAGKLSTGSKFLVDVSLAAGDNLEMFSSDATNEFSETGLVLLRRLIKVCPDLCRRENTIVYTAHYTTELWSKIEAFCIETGFRNWQKHPGSNIDELISLVLG